MKYIAAILTFLACATLHAQFDSSPRTTPFSRTLLLSVDEAAARSVLNIAGGTNVYAFDADQFTVDGADIAFKTNLLSRTVSTVAQLVALDPTKPWQFVNVLGYHSPNDGGGGVFVFTNTVTSTNLGTRIALSTAGWSAERVINDGVYNVKHFGAKGDGSTDDKDSFNAAIDIANSSGGTVYVPADGYYTSGAFNAITNSTILAQGATITTAPSLESALFTIGGISGEYTQGRLALLPKVEHGFSPYDSWVYSTNSVGFKLVNCRDWSIIGGESKYFRTGILLTSDTKGSVFNRIEGLHVIDCLQSIVLQSGTDGWVNDNTFIGGSVSQGSTLTNITSGWRHVLIDGNGQSRNNNNRFIGVGFEGGVQGGSDYWVEIIDGSENVFRDCRWEPFGSYPAPTFQFTSTGGTAAVGDSQYSRYNHIEAGSWKGTPTLTETGSLSENNWLRRNQFIYTPEYAVAPYFVPIEDYKIGFRYDLNGENGIELLNFGTGTSKRMGYSLRVGPTSGNYATSDFVLFQLDNSNADFAGRAAWIIDDTGNSENPEGFFVFSDDTNDTFDVAIGSTATSELSVQDDLVKVTALGQYTKDLKLDDDLNFSAQTSSIDIGTTDTATQLNIDSPNTTASSALSIRVGQLSTTSGADIRVYSADGTANIQHVLRSQSNSYVQAQTGNFGIGTTSPGQKLDVAGGIEVNGNIVHGSGGPIWTAGAGSPEGSITAVVGSLYTRTDGGAGSTLYVKESGTGNTGWAAK